MSLFSFGGGSHGPPPVRPLVVYRVDGRQGDAGARADAGEPAAALAQGGHRRRASDPVVYNYLDGGGGFSGIPSTIITPALLFSDVDIRRQTGKNRKPPLYPPPGFKE